MTVLTHNGRRIEARYKKGKNYYFVMQRFIGGPWDCYAFDGKRVGGVSGTCTYTSEAWALAELAATAKERKWSEC